MVERGTRRLALPAYAVRRVLKGGTMTRVSDAPAHFVGLADDRGRALPVLCVDPWLGLEHRPWASGDSVVVMESDGVRFGVLVDRVDGVGILIQSTADPQLAEAASEVAPGFIAGCKVGPYGSVAVLAAPVLARAAIAATDRLSPQAPLAPFDADLQALHGSAA
jgi:chemotaxis signal transduction protein